MKKTITAILLLALCLGLCACSGVKQEVYDAAVADIEAAKAEYEDLSVKYRELTADYEAAKAKAEQYADVIDALEAEDYDGAVKAVNAMRPAPDVTEVEITMDNLWDYFEITEDRLEEKDAEGNLYQVQIQHNLSLKKEYELAEGDEYPTDVAVGYEYDEFQYSFGYPCEIDFDDFSCSEDPVYTYDSHESKTVNFPQTPWMHSNLAQCKADQENIGESETAYIILTDSVEFLNARGKLYLVNK